MDCILCIESPACFWGSSILTGAIVALIIVVIDGRRDR